MTIAFDDDLTVSQGRTAAARLVFPDTDTSGEELRVQLVDSLGEPHTIGSSMGAPAGEEILVDLAFDPPTGPYTARVVNEDGEELVPTYYDKGDARPDRPEVRIVE